MLRFVAIIAMLLHGINLSYSQESPCEKYIVYDEFSEKIEVVGASIHDTSFNMIIKGVVYDCMGAADIKYYTKDNKIISEGSYINSLDTLVRYEDAVNEFGDLQAIYVEHYFKPLKNGEWKYYDENVKLSYIKTFDAGVLKK